MPEIRLLHTSDFHDRLTPAKAARLRALKAEHGALLVDTGDAILAPNVLVMPWRERAIALMNEAGYDAMGLGNREYFFRNRGMAWKTGHARFPRLCSNLQAPGIESWTVLVAPGGVRLGLLALMPTMIAPGHPLERLSDARFRPWPQAAFGAMDALRTASDLVVAMFHRPNAEIAELCSLLPGIRLVLAGHSHLLESSLSRLPAGQSVSSVGAGASHVRLVALRSEDGTVTMDRLLGLEPEAP
jgi:2',3'-cyclic-nucleotide 2'-phosphodiesterase (5'-nucleotidase family)